MKALKNTKQNLKLIKSLIWLLTLSVIIPKICIMGMIKKKKRKLPDVLNDIEREKILSHHNRKCPTGARNYAIILLMLNCGLRVSEVVKLSRDAIDMTNSKTRGRIIIRDGKGGNDRILWLSESDLDAMLKWRNMAPVKSKYFFSTIKGSQGNQLTARYIREMVRIAGLKSIGRHVYPHLLRHTFATDIYRSNGIRICQETLGHKDIRTTMIYSHISGEEIRGAMRTLRNQ